MEAHADTHDSLQFPTEQGWIEIEEKKINVLHTFIYIYVSSKLWVLFKKDLRTWDLRCTHTHFHSLNAAICQQTWQLCGIRGIVFLNHTQSCFKSPRSRIREVNLLVSAPLTCCHPLVQTPKLCSQASARPPWATVRGVCICFVGFNPTTDRRQQNSLCFFTWKEKLQKPNYGQTSLTPEFNSTRAVQRAAVTAAAPGCVISHTFQVLVVR